MTLASGDNLRALYGRRLSGEDGHFDSFELGFYEGMPQDSINDSFYAVPLVLFPLSSSWATYYTNVGVRMAALMKVNTTTAGICGQFRFNGIKGGILSRLLMGSVSAPGGGGDIQFSDVAWSVGLPVTIKKLDLRPPSTTRNAL